MDGHMYMSLTLVNVNLPVSLVVMFIHFLLHTKDPTWDNITFAYIRATFHLSLICSMGSVVSCGLETQSLTVIPAAATMIQINVTTALYVYVSFQNFFLLKEATIGETICSFKHEK